MRNPRINPVTHAVEQWVHQLPAELLSCVGASHVDLLKSFPSAYAVYPPLLLWPRHTFSSLSWKDIRTRAHPDDLERLYSSVADAAKVEYIAVNHGIPTRNASDGTENVVRSPSNLEPLYGDFGAAVTHPPTPPDLQSALWVSARQNGVVQVWAPLYTMFSQGNVSEKARIMTLPTLKAGVLDAATSSAVDLYGGIGYFVFSYARAGVGKVLVWEINPWSVEGLRRGAEANKWATSIRAAGSPWAVGGDERIVVFQESNDEALSRVTSARSALPPIRHVNCGLLPTSAPIWHDAVAILDPSLGGWVHAHENIARASEESRVKEITALFQGYAGQHRKVECARLERVKSYSPGVYHCVLDMYVGASA